MIFTLFGWLIYALVVGLVAKYLHPGDDPIGFWQTIGVGIAGSYLGGLINWLLGYGGFLQPSGLFMGIVGGIFACFIYKYVNSHVEK